MNKLKEGKIFDPAGSLKKIRNHEYKDEKELRQLIDRIEYGYAPGFRDVLLNAVSSSTPVEGTTAPVEQQPVKDTAGAPEKKDYVDLLSKIPEIDTILAPKMVGSSNLYHALKGKSYDELVNYLSKKAPLNDRERKAVLSALSKL